MSQPDGDDRPPDAHASADANGHAPRAPLDRALLDWRRARDRVDTYLSAFGSTRDRVRLAGRRILERALARGTSQSAVADAMDELGVGLADDIADARDGEGAPASAGWRLAVWRSARASGVRPSLRELDLDCGPPLARRAMTTDPSFLRRLARRRERAAPSAESEPGTPERADLRRARDPWRASGRRRRALLAVLVLIPSILAGAAFLTTLPARVWLPAELALALFFGALFGWISLGFWTAVSGFLVLLRGGDRLGVSWRAGDAAAPLDGDFRTAIVMPVFDEPVDRVFAGLRAMRASLERAGAVDAFDVFVLSDSAAPDAWADEEMGWAEWRQDIGGAGGVFYRHRRIRQKRKSGNVADFCRRYGRLYRYMVVLDADSVMSGETLVRLVELMQSHPHVAVLQTAPRIVRARSLFARVQQLSGRLYGPMFTAGMQYWQLGDSPYWGHNAILRVRPFMRHCGLPRLPGRPPFGGDILSHDFVEAALLGRAGWSIWLLPDGPGSYEETPGSLLEEMRRDQRWCQGNLQHLRLLFAEGLSNAHRAVFLNGVFSYVSAILWLGFLVASTADALMWTLRGPDYFAAGPTLFPTWPVWRPERVEALFLIVACVLLLPKLLAVTLVLRRGEASSFGGATGLLRSVALESLASALLAPIRMAFYGRFVIGALLGRSVGWHGGGDDEGETTWGEALRRHGLDTVFAGAWATLVYGLHPAAFWWLAPIAIALVSAVPLSVWASRVSIGSRARRAGWLVTPEERQPPAEIADLEAWLSARQATRWRGFVGAVVDPVGNAVHRLLRRGARSLAPKLRAERERLVERARHDGPDALSDRERRVVLSDAAALGELHEGVWRLEDAEAAARWRLDDPPARLDAKGA